MKRFILILIILTTGIPAQAQQPGEFKFGIKAGLNFATFASPSERSATDEKLESNSIVTRFMLGPTLRYALTDMNGFILEVQYSQKGGNYDYVGDSYWLVEDFTSEPLYFEGNSSIALNINNGYIDIPIMYYQSINDNVSFYGGGYVGFLLNSTGAGTRTFNADSRQLGFGGNVVDLRPFSIELDHNYKSDIHRDSTIYVPQPIYDDNDTSISSDDERIPDFFAPAKVGAYYDYEERKGDFYKSIDAGIIAGVDYKFDSGLGIGLRANYGLIDITNDVYDYSKVSTVDPANNDYTRILRSDKDRNLVFQLYIGFEL